jgi:two-component system chemotaxis response regulator CheB
MSTASFDQNGIVAIGASTGGVEAIHEVMRNLPKNLPGVVIAQHIPQHFSTAFANRLNQSCGLEVREAVSGDVLRPGLALLAPGDFHMLVRRSGARYTIELQQGPKVCYQRPAVDVLFASVASAAKQNGVGVLLTGMGADGAQGMLKMRQAGAVTIAQDEASCVVYGMPREAAKLGAAMHIVPLSGISAAIVREASRLKSN